MTFKPLLTATAMALVLAACSDTKETSVTDTPATEAAAMVYTYVPAVYDIAGQRDEDHLWLEEVEGERALETVTAWNSRTLDRLKADPRYATLYADALEIMQSKGSPEEGRAGQVVSKSGCGGECKKTEQ